ncbi:class I SAM-dependent methyltransferase [Sphingobacterium kitahiroshimense]|uniref:class I SAM-dependent methyltransferase n=1 Tax=Sphingobacterium kitahiroshimense TaxID=470446 RepID=UPI003209BD7B
MISEPLKSKFKISPTASLVLCLASELYRDGKTCQAYVENIDTSEGESLVKSFKQVFEHSESIAILRKRYIRHLFEDYAKQFPKFQVCILGAGLDPLSLYLLEQYHDQIETIFEVDMESMDEKRAMYTKLIGDNDKLKLITHDATDIDALLDELKKMDYHASIPTIFLLEGFVYYISRDKFSTLLEKLASADGQKAVILDYVIPFEAVHESNREKSRLMLRSLEQGLGWPIMVYHTFDITGLIQFFKGNIITSDSTQSMEKTLYGENKIYIQPTSGFMEIISFQF